MNKTILFCGIMLCSFFANSQEISAQLICSAGDFSQNSSYQLEWSIGEVITEQFNSDDFSLNQGFQQGTLEVSSVSEKFKNNFDVNVFPNPFNEYISIAVSELDCEIQIYLTDISGKVLINETCNLNRSNKLLNLSTFSAGIYFLNVQSGKTKNNQIFKIVKQ